MIDYQGIQFQFVLSSHMWRIDGELVLPTEEQLKEVIDRCVVRLYAEPEGAQIEVGHLIVKKRAGGLHDVFLHYGTIGEEDE